jgi:hypothetical protein
MFEWLVNNSDVSQAITSIATAVISIAAIVVSIVTYSRQEKSSKESVRPFLSFELIDLPRRLGIKLRNDGLGVAKVKSAKFYMLHDRKEMEIELGDTLIESIDEALMLSRIGEIDRDSWKRYLDSYENLALASASERFLIEIELSKTDDITILEIPRKVLSKIRAELFYADIHDNEQPALTANFKYFGRGCEYAE